MTPQARFDELIEEGRHALAAMQDDPSRRAFDVIDRISRLKVAEGRILGFLEAATLLDPELGETLTAKAQGFLAEAIAARLLLG